MKGIIRVDLRTRKIRNEGVYRTEDQQQRAYRRLLGENSREDVSFLMGELVQVTDSGVCTEEGQTEFIITLQRSGGMVLIPEDKEENLDSFKVLVLGDLDNFRRALWSRLPHAQVDTLDGPLPYRDHVRKASILPDGKYEARKKKEEDRLLIRGVKDLPTFEEVVRRAAEILRSRPHLQTELAAVVGNWRPGRKA